MLVQALTLAGTALASVAGYRKLYNMLALQSTPEGKPALTLPLSRLNINPRTH